ncbi:hypothetical protein EUTSA_v10022512mg [Eutrema salsugineum]|uniref:Uncharacterized protein n=1 Tax=Eutrema salsugineum TaxID=72664 RepID=V4KZQ9_EUTSA|nr:hypothetical protein EUTSA_v10022512mg [Eutrema salsugineum]
MNLFFVMFFEALQHLKLSLVSLRLLWSPFSLKQEIKKKRLSIAIRNIKETNNQMSSFKSYEEYQGLKMHNRLSNS